MNKEEKLKAAELRVKEYIDGYNPYLEGKITEVRMCKEFVDDVFLLAKKYLEEKYGDSDGV